MCVNTSNNFCVRDYRHFYSMCLLTGTGLNNQFALLLIPFFSASSARDAIHGSKTKVELGLFFSFDFSTNRTTIVLISAAKTFLPLLIIASFSRTFFVPQTNLCVVLNCNFYGIDNACQSETCFPNFEILAVYYDFLMTPLSPSK